MNNAVAQRSAKPPRRSAWGSVGGLLLMLALGACETVQDVGAEVGDWARRQSLEDPVTGQVSDQAVGAEIATGETAGVLDKPSPISPADIRATTPQGLFADRANAAYSPVLTAKTTALPAAAPPGPPGSEPQVATQPEPRSTQLVPAAPLPPPKPEPPPPPTLGPAETPAPGSVGAGNVELVGIIFFADGAAQLDSRDAAVLQAVVALHKQNGGIIRVVGYASGGVTPASAGGSGDRSQAVASARAESVGQALVRLGVPPAEIVPQSGSAAGAPIYEFMPPGEAGQRRTEIYLEY